MTITLHVGGGGELKKKKTTGEYSRRHKQKQLLRKVRRTISRGKKGGGVKNRPLLKCELLPDMSVESGCEYAK